MIKLFETASHNPTVNAQRNLQGRTHYVDPETLRFHKSRIISARVVDNGLLFAIVTSDSLNFENSKRGFRFVIFDIFGTVLSRTEIDGAFRRSEQASKAMWDVLNAIDAKAHTAAAIEKHRASVMQECDELAARIAKTDI
ncbi:hypothetical protein BRAO375_3660058 [Bradyrhizobium sp. ORS 375]|uniref:hypothetical protein n=1 Tax=Bradyrhizobium sp. (strain ORS 375) TaxID=566679 RepID=UPI000240699A|nr:hypothetical protein [Bradyrhizobium sp. ORS 375]CCD94664.1 hypothetical protein BRAO375_3660058 [Bradyrhizobium sp. ORS 375]